MSKRKMVWNCYESASFLQTGYGTLIIEYYAIQGMHDLFGGFIQTRAY